MLNLAPTLRIWLIKKWCLRVNTDYYKIIIQLQIGLEIILFPQVRAF